MNALEEFRQYLTFTKTLNVLLVEDSDEVRMQITKMLQNIFNEVHTATNGEEGLQCYFNYNKENEKNYDIVITDISMPKMEGTTFCKEIVAFNEDQLILAISAYTNPDKLVDLINSGVFKFIQKPINQENLLKTIEQAIGQLK